MKIHSLAGVVGISLVVVRCAGAQLVGTGPHERGVTTAEALVPVPVELTLGADSITFAPVEAGCCSPQGWDVFPKGLWWVDFCTPRVCHEATDCGGGHGAPAVVFGRPVWTHRSADDYPLIRFLRWCHLLGWEKTAACDAPYERPISESRSRQPQPKPPRSHEPTPAPTVDESHLPDMPRVPHVPHVPEPVAPSTPREAVSGQPAPGSEPQPAADAAGPTTTAPTLQPITDPADEPPVPPNVIPEEIRLRSSRRNLPSRTAGYRLRDYIDTQ